jgi:Leucine-rich repeat (LRR) protein
LSRSHQSSISDSYESDNFDRSEFDESALRDYTSFCRDGDRMLEKSKMTGEKVKNPLLSYLGAITSQKKVPKSFGLSHIKKKREINLKSFYLRESYVEAFSESLALETNLKVLNLSRNQLTTNRLIKILLKLPRGVRELNLSNNP